MPVLKIKSSSFPKLRFKEFKSEFVKMTLNEISTAKIGYGLSRETIVKNGKKKCIFYGDLFTKYNPINPKIITLTSENGKIFSTKNNLLFASRYSNNNTFFKPVSLNEENILIGNFINLLEIDKNFSSDYISLYFQNFNNAKNVYKIIEGSLAQQLHLKYLKNIEIKVSENLSEQNKIINFFTRIFEKIAQENKLKNSWELLLKSINEKTFEKNKNIKDYYTLHDELNIYFNKFSGLSGVTSFNFKQIGKKYLPYKKIYDKKICNENDLLNVNFKSTNQNLILRNDILITLSSETQDEVGISSLYNSDYHAYLNSFCFGIRLKDEFKNKIYPKYINLILSFSEYRKLIFKLSNGTTRYNLSPNLFSKLIIKIPNWKSQILISNMVYKIIDVIEIQTQLIEKIETMKKYFLNSMF